MWYAKKIDDLSAREYHEILFERVRVFVVEQKSAFQEVDEIDLEAVHLYKKEDGEIQAYIRIYEKEDGRMSFGRVLVPEEHRGLGLGKKLLQKTLLYLEENHPGQDVLIEAESYLEKFYTSFGFETCGGQYLDFDILHQPMVLKRN